MKQIDYTGSTARAIALRVAATKAAPVRLSYLRSRRLRAAHPDPGPYQQPLSHSLSEVEMEHRSDLEDLLMCGLTDAERCHVANSLREAMSAKLRQKRAEDETLINGDGDLNAKP